MRQSRGGRGTGRPNRKALRTDVSCISCRCEERAQRFAGNTTSIWLWRLEAWRPSIGEQTSHSLDIDHIDLSVQIRRDFPNTSYCSLARTSEHARIQWKTACPVVRDGCVSGSKHVSTPVQSGGSCRSVDGDPHYLAIPVLRRMRT